MNMCCLETWPRPVILLQTAGNHFGNLTNVSSNRRINGFEEWRVMSEVNGHNGMGRGSIGREYRRCVRIGRHPHSQSVNRTGLNASRFCTTFGLFVLEKCRLRVVPRGRSPRSSVMQLYLAQGTLGVVWSRPPTTVHNSKRTLIK